MKGGGLNICYTRHEARSRVTFINDLRAWEEGTKGVITVCYYEYMSGRNSDGEWVGAKSQETKMIDVLHDA